MLRANIYLRSTHANVESWNDALGSSNSVKVYSIDDIKTLDVDKWGIRQPKYFDKEREDGSVQLSSPRMKLFTSSASDVWVLLNLFYCTGLIFTYRIADRSY